MILTGEESTCFILLDSSGKIAMLWSFWGKNISWLFGHARLVCDARSFLWFFWPIKPKTSWQASRAHTFLKKKKKRKIGRTFLCFLGSHSSAASEKEKIGRGHFWFGGVFLWRHRLVCPRAKTAHTFTWQDDYSHVDPLVVTCGRDSIVSLCTEGFEIHFNTD